MPPIKCSNPYRTSHPHNLCDSAFHLAIPLHPQRQRTDRHHPGHVLIEGQILVISPLLPVHFGHPAVIEQSA